MSRRNRDRKFSKEKAPQFTETEFAKLKKFNDGSWYTYNPQLLKDAASVPFSQILGSPTTPPHMGDYNVKTTYPGVWRITYVPGPGVSVDGSSAVNVAALNIYADIRYKNSGRKNYDAPDYMLFLFAVCNCFAMFAHLRRAYGVARRFSATNRYMPMGLLQAMGFDPKEVLDHLNDLRNRLNMFAARLSTLVVPNVMSLYLRQFWLNSNVYKDSEDEKSQLYIFVPDIYYVYNEKSSSTGGFCEAKHINNSAKNTLDEWYAMLDEQIEALITSEDIGLMIGDTKKRFENNVFTVDQVSEDYVVTPEHEISVLSQIQNSTAIGAVDPDLQISTFDVSNDPDTNTLTWNPVFKAISPSVMANKLITLPLYNPEPIDIMEATRLTTIPSKCLAGIEDSTPWVQCSHSGTEIVTTYAIGQYIELQGKWDFNYWGSWHEEDAEHIFTDVDLSRLTSVTDLQYAIDILGVVSAFNFHPEFRFWRGTWEVNEESGQLQYTNFRVSSSVVDVENYAYLTEYNLGRIHDVAVLSEFSVPLEKSGTTV